MDAKSLIKRGDHLFGKRENLLLMWQDVAEQCYVERADFTVNRVIGDTFADNLTTSYPMMLRRDLGNSFSAMLRNQSIDWFSMRASREEYEDQPAMEWLEWASGTMRRAMYDRRSLFTRATKEGDHDYAAFGQCVISVELNRNADGLLYRDWHLRDCAWCENEEGVIDTLHRKWKPTAAMLAALFGDKIHTKVREKMTSTDPAAPYAEIAVRHIVMPSAEYDPSIKAPYVSVYIDADNNHIMEVTPQTYFMYVVPRWQTVSGSQYAYSPATVAALPDARLLQAMSRVLLEAGEKATNPPMVAVQEAIRSDISIYAGGVTWVDKEYDERLGEVLRPLTQDKSGMPIGIDMRRDVMAMLKEAFFLNTLTLPEAGPEMTAYEVGQRIQEYIRQAAPVFEPVEADYNGALCETTFELMLRAGAFGNPQDIPQSIRGKDIQFRFVSPLHQAVEQQKGNLFMQVKGILADTLALDPSVKSDVDVKTAFRDVISAIGAPAKWLNSEDEAAKIQEAEDQAQAAQQLIATMGAGATVAKTMGEASQALNAGEVAQAA
jgi:hypothetical protein